MDRQIVYAGSIPLDTDLLQMQRNVMVSVAALARAVLGDGGLVDGLVCVPGTGAYSVVLGPGSYTAPFELDALAFGALAADPTVIVRTALLPDYATLQLGAPPTADQVLVWLVQIAIVESDTVPVALPYWNAANPSVPYSGPGNSGVAQNTRRQLRVALSVKASSPQPYLNGVPPVADPGWVGLYAVTTFLGKPGIAQADIAVVGGAPTMRFKLPALPPGPSAMQVFGSSTNWQAPDGVRLVRVRLAGAGGGGGGGQDGFSGGGGGAGGYAEGFLPVVPGQIYNLVVGAGGAGGGPGSTGLGGGASGFAGVVSASAGQGGGSGNPNSHGGSPGNGSGGALTQAGGYGGDGAIVVNVPGGNGGASAFGGGGRGADQGGTPAVAVAAGSGGGGAYGAGATGGSGANGIVVIEY